ncbi:hypothetical protein J3R30DRAFT_131739 [Lentinula aciculospora]|uniref:Uncharacterized protein n=1 Tax=Lentinula aciculospora TaxID=153920 RepID=A0A9W9DY91_9AGAR|nr:hypothetical protein J3R30DRAFT_131739 [Lentinula aciculospora]
MYMVSKHNPCQRAFGVICGRLFSASVYKGRPRRCRPYCTINSYYQSSATTMSVVEKNSVMEKILEWANDVVNAEKIEKAYNQKGGWEGWVQVELAMYLQKVLGGQGIATILREQNVYNGNSQKCDFLIKTQKENGEYFTNMFELKCESSGNAGKFRTEVRDDCTKIANGVWNTEFNPCEAWIVAFSVTKNVADFMVGGRNLRRYYKTIQAGQIQMSVWWGSRA